MSQYPITLQHPWILTSILSTILPNKHYTSNLIKRKFIKDNKVNNTKSSIIRIYQFLKICQDGSVTGIVNDSNHKVLVKFTYECIKKFESYYRQRISFETMNCLFLINQASLKFINNFELTRDFDNFNSKFNVVILEIDQCKIFSRDKMTLPVKIENLLRFIYDNVEYKELCGNFDEEDYEEYEQLDDDNYDILSVDSE